MINSSVTWLLPHAVAEDQLVFLNPPVASIQQSTQILMSAVLASQADSDITVNLSSDEPGRVSVPASVLIPTGESFGNFAATAGIELGPAIISASVIKTVQSTITVTQALPGLRPKGTGVKELKPRITRIEQE